MKTCDFFYDLPKHLIAQQPCDVRSQSRLLHYSRSTKNIQHQPFLAIELLVESGDLLVFNNTKVIPARLYGNKETGGKVEVLVERLINAQQCLAHVKASKTPKVGAKIIITKDNYKYKLEVVARKKSLFILQSSFKPMVNKPATKAQDSSPMDLAAMNLAQMIQNVGHMPLPPYIQRSDTAFDSERYQTVYAKKVGAVAAPTAGLHFDLDLLKRLQDKGVNFAEVTLHIGAGTFQPVRCENITEHKMHSEYLELSQKTVDLCRQTRAKGKRIIAVGTTAVRCLETASQKGVLATYQGETDIFIYPGYQFKSVDALITNFHLPESTLIMLISAFAGLDEIKNCYKEAVKQQYRFFSYGDAMFIS